jgi:hypothetical protein
MNINIMINMKRQISDTEKQILLNNHRKSDGKIYCFIDNEPIDDEKSIQFDHIAPFIETGQYNFR